MVSPTTTSACATASATSPSTSSREPEIPTRKKTTAASTAGSFAPEAKSKPTSRLDAWAERASAFDREYQAAKDATGDAARQLMADAPWDAADYRPLPEQLEQLLAVAYARGAAAGPSEAVKARHARIEAEVAKLAPNGDYATYALVNSDGSRANDESDGNFYTDVIAVIDDGRTTGSRVEKFTIDPDGELTHYDTAKELAL